jgi:tRNA (guanine37-N1)-methyltransferase
MMMPMRIDVVTIFPEALEPFLRASLLGKAAEKGLLQTTVHNLRNYTDDPHRKVDDEPYGGGPGMVMTAQPFFDAVEAIDPQRTAHVILLTPQGRTFSQAVAAELAAREHLILLCGRYEGVDERVATHLVDEELSIGDYVLAGGEVASLVIIETISRLIPGVVGEPASVEQDSFSEGRLDHPHYTRPADFRGHAVPEVLLSGNHAEIERWRRDQAERRTRERRPDLLEDC